MAMISCPSCGGQVSDKAKKCVHCGMVLIPEEKRYCPECGAELEEGAVLCEKCGCPAEEMKDVANLPQAVEVTGVKIAKKSKRIFIVLLIFIAVCTAIAYGKAQMQREKAIAAAEKEAAEAAKISEEYSANLEMAAYSMIASAGQAEECGNLIQQVWYNAIYEERNTSTDKYTRPNGYFVTDFNDALNNLFEDSSFQTKISNIEKNQDTMNSLMKELKNPPEEYEDAYEAVSELYDAYLTLTNLVVNPTGSLQTFSDDFNDADSEALKCFNAVSIYLED